tara:strand:+ start:221 stop:493 length:273 start_codon:yes stop_codon:yes gene_type:complete
MNKLFNHGYVAFEEYVLKGNRITILEAALYFGVSNTYDGIRRIKAKGFIIKKSPVTMAKILTRINKQLKVEHFKGLPVSDIIMHEYWLSK